MNIWTLTLLDATLVIVLAVIGGLLLIWAGDRAISRLWPDDKIDATPYVAPGPGLDMDAIYSNPRLRFADPAPKATRPPRSDDANNVNAGL